MITAARPTSSILRGSSHTALPGGAAPPAWARLARGTGWFAIALVAVLVVLEGLFASAHVGEEQYIAVAPIVGTLHLPSKFVTWRSEGYSQSVFNAAGFHDTEWTLAKPHGIKRIAVIGDSMTEGMQVNPGQVCTSVLQRKLDALYGPGHYQVMNFAMAGFSTVQGVYLFKTRIAQYQPDVCILDYHMSDNEKNGKTDFVEFDLCRPYCEMAPSGRLVTDWSSFAPSSKNAASARYAQQTEYLRRNSRIWDVTTKLDSQLRQMHWYENFRTAGARWANTLIARLSSHSAKAAEVSPAFSGKTDTLSDMTGSDSAKTAPTATGTRFASISEALPLPTQLPEKPMPQGLSVKLQKEIQARRLDAVSWRAIMEATRQRFSITGRLIEVLNVMCEENRCKLMVVALPAPNNSALYFRELRGIKALAAYHNFAFIDAQETFPSFGPADKNDLYYNIHFTRKGHELLANAMLKGLKRSALVTQESPGGLLPARPTRDSVY